MNEIFESDTNAEDCLYLNVHSSDVSINLHNQNIIDLVAKRDNFEKKNYLHISVIWKKETSNVLYTW